MLRSFGRARRAVGQREPDTLAALTELKQSILHKAFSGELTAKPDRLPEAAD